MGLTLIDSHTWNDLFHPLFPLYARRPAKEKVRIRAARRHAVSLSWWCLSNSQRGLVIGSRRRSKGLLSFRNQYFADTNNLSYPPFRLFDLSPIDHPGWTFEPCLSTVMFFVTAIFFHFLIFAFHALSLDPEINNVEDPILPRSDSLIPRKNGGGDCPPVWKSVVSDLSAMFVDTSNGQCNDNARAAIRESIVKSCWIRWVARC